jgi:hypothetical protein
MRSQRPPSADKIAKALGADRVVALEAIQDTIEVDRARLREFKRQEALKAYGRGRLEDAFEAIAGEDFEDR